MALTSAAFGASEETFAEVMSSVDRVMIRGEYSDRSDVEGIDNVIVSLPVATDLVSYFDLGDEGWRGGRDVSLSWSELGGNPGGFLLGEDLGSGQTWYYVSPPLLGWELDPLRRGRVELRAEGGGFGERQLRIRGCGPDIRLGRVLSIVVLQPPPGSSWTRCQVSLVPSSFKEAGGSFKSIMEDVSEVWIRGEYSNMKDLGGLDNVMVTLGPEG